MKNPFIPRTPDPSDARATGGGRARRLVLFAALCLFATAATAPILSALKGDRLPLPGDSLAKRAFDDLSFEALGELLPGVSSPLAANWLSTGAVEYTLADSGAVEQAAAPIWHIYAGAADDDLKQVDVAAHSFGSMLAMATPVSVTGTTYATDDIPLSSGMMAATYPPMLLAALASGSAPTTSEPEIDGRKRVPLLRTARTADRGDGIHAKQEIAPAAVYAAGSGPNAGLADHSGPLFRFDRGDLPGLADRGHAVGSTARAHAPGLLDPLRDPVHPLSDPDHAWAGNATTVEHIVLATAAVNGPLPMLQQASLLLPLQVGAPVPEPTTLALVALGVVGIGFSCRKRQPYV